jgi:hypothetical protein
MLIIFPVIHLQQATMTGYYIPERVQTFDLKLVLNAANFGISQQFSPLISLSQPTSVIGSVTYAVTNSMISPTKFRDMSQQTMKFKS